MTKKIIFTAICILSFAGMQAQVSFNPGIRAGGSFAKLSQMDADFKTGFYFSGFGTLRIGSLYALQPEISYTEQGAANVKLYTDDYNQNPDEATYETTDIELSYISVGITNKFYFQDNFNVHLGPILDFQNGQSRYTDIDVDISFAGGLEYMVTDQLGIEFRAKKGLVDVLDFNYRYYAESAGDNLGNHNSNFVLQLGLSYVFDFSK